MAGNCSRTFEPSSSNPPGVAKKGEVLIFHIVPPVVYPCHEKVNVISGAQLQQESGSSFQVMMTADHALVQITIWCNALLPDGETEGASVCTDTTSLVLGKSKQSYIDCLKHCLTDLTAFFAIGGLYFAILGIIFGFLFGGPIGAVVGGYGGALIPLATGGVFCAIKCFFETW